MWNRIDHQISAADLQGLKNDIEALSAKFSFAKGLSPSEKQKGGWYLGVKAKQLFEKTLMVAKQTPSYYPLLDVPAFERDIALIQQLHNLSQQLDQLKSKIDNTQRILRKDAAEQSFYVYSQLQIMHQNGIKEGSEYPHVKLLMPRNGKKKLVVE